MRWLVVIVAIVVAAAVGIGVGYFQWGTQAAHIDRLEERVQSTQSEAATLRTQNEDLQQRLQQVQKEQERLAQENEILRKQETTEQLLNRQSGELPVLPPK